jgi:hypothetical protein
MIIDNKKYKLPIGNYVPIECEKKQIIFGNTFNHNMKHFIGWLNRYNGNYRKTASFTIDFDGNVYKHFEPKYRSKYFKDNNLNDKSIVILLENDGWLIKNYNTDEYITLNGDIYRNKDLIVEKNWRNETYWCDYSDKQLESAIELVIMLCNKFRIPKIVTEHNTKIDGIKDFSGIFYKANIEKYFIDLNPSWKYELFKDKIENYERKDK